MNNVNKSRSERNDECNYRAFPVILLKPENS